MSGSIETIPTQPSSRSPKCMLPSLPPVGPAGAAHHLGQHAAGRHAADEVGAEVAVQDAGAVARAERERRAHRHGLLAAAVVEAAGHLALAVEGERALLGGAHEEHEAQQLAAVVRASADASWASVLLDRAPRVSRSSWPSLLPSRPDPGSPAGLRRLDAPGGVSAAHAGMYAPRVPGIPVGSSAASAWLRCKRGQGRALLDPPTALAPAGRDAVAGVRSLHAARRAGARRSCRRSSTIGLNLIEGLLIATFAQPVPDRRGGAVHRQAAERRRAGGGGGRHCHAHGGSAGGRARRPARPRGHRAARGRPRGHAWSRAWPTGR